MEGLFAVVFPSNCRICADPLTCVSRLPVCQQCLDGLRPISGRLCSICGERVLSSVAGAGADEPFQCPLCQRLAPPFAKAVAYGSYDGGLREMIHLLKYAAVLPAAGVLGRTVAEAMFRLDPVLGDSPIVVIPVPLHKSKRRQRGFNQAELIARAALKLHDSARFQLATNILERKRETKSQIGMTNHQRRENMRGAFAVDRTGQIDGRQILLVDDVLTTGATAAECARVLIRAGAARVWVATAARTLKQASNEDDSFRTFKASEFQGTNETEAGKAEAAQ